MKNIVGIKFENNDRIEYFYVDKLNLHKNVSVIVNQSGMENFGYVATPIHAIDSSKITRELGTVIRISSKKDYQNYQNNIKKAKSALRKCRELVEKYKLDMNIIDATYTFHQEQLIFTFYADNRVDFRDLAKELASIYKTRIELHQIGVRDKAKKVGGVGLCGQKLCCSRFLNNFDSVSISMAKNQNLSLNPNKINGVCGRLLCCLKYENNTYLEEKQSLPQVGQTVTTSDGTGKVISVDILAKTYKVDIMEKGIVEYHGTN
jgi:cell fate regulator YaaT (PSP1 superfamily)